MTIEVDVTLADLISGKKAVLYTPNNNGEMPNASVKQFVPSGINIGLDEWFVGYTPVIVSGYNMVELADEVLSGLQHFCVVDGVTAKYNAYGTMNENKEKVLITLTEAEKARQVIAKKFVLIVALNKKLDKKLESYFNQFSTTEKATWDLQLAEAKAFIADATASTPLLSEIASGRGITVSDLAQKVVEKASVYQTKVASLIGAKQSVESLIQAASTDAELVELTATVAQY